MWVQKLLDNQKEKLRDKQKVPNQANQIQTQIMIERRNLLFALKRGALHSQDVETRSFREDAVKYDRTEKRVVCRDEHHKRPTVARPEQTTHPRFSREGQNLIFEDEMEDEINHDRTGKPVVCRDAGFFKRDF